MPLLESNETFKFTYDTMLQWIADTSDGDIVRIDAAMEEIARHYDMSKGEVLADFLRDRGFNINQAADGSWRGSFYSNPANFNVQTNPINSNMNNVYRGSVRQWYSNTPQFDTSTGLTFLKPSRFPVSGGLGQQAIYTVASVGSAINAVSAGITLGKIIDGALYNANPNYWDSIGMSSLNPETWNSITNGSDSPFAGLFNMILGLDPNTGKTQAYMDENAFAYMAYALAQNGFFGADIVPAYNTLTVGQTITADDVIIGTVFDLCMLAGFTTIDWTAYYPSRYMSWPAIMAKLHGDYVVVFNDENSSFLNGTRWTISNVGSNGVGTTSPDILNQNYALYFYRGATQYYGTASSGTFNGKVVLPDNVNSTATGILLANAATPLEGVSNQTDATLPDISNWNSLDDVLPSLQQQYPDMFANPLVWDNVQPDGTNPQLRYIPVAMPEAKSATDTQPTSGAQTQTQTQIGTGISTDTLLQLITDLMTQTQPDTATQTVPQNPTDTGTGTTAPPALPTGNASALWSVYHPTQAQVNQFGAWLWTGNIITQIQQLLQNPMEGIITLHKVFAPPVDSGSGTIVVGRLDSEVPSATVNQQYVTVDCGSIDCYEQFGNVFDYSPHTNVSLYLPFIGIVPLNTDDIMRSTIHITYGVDVFTGACLAMIEVSRDGNTANLYQYAGVASVEYPLTGSVHSGLITGLLGVAGSIAATVATGGVTAPAAIAAVGGAASAGKSQNARAGGFSGNAGAMGIKIPYLIIERPQTKVADTFAELSGYPTNYSCKLGDCSGHVTVKHTHIHGINATDSELNQIDTLLKSGVIV